MRLKKYFSILAQKDSMIKMKKKKENQLLKQFKNSLADLKAGRVKRVC